MNGAGARTGEEDDEVHRHHEGDDNASSSSSSSHGSGGGGGGTGNGISTTPLLLLAPSRAPPRPMIPPHDDHSEVTTGPATIHHTGATTTTTTTSPPAATNHDLEEEEAASDSYKIAATTTTTLSSNHTTTTTTARRYRKTAAQEIRADALRIDKEYGVPRPRPEGSSKTTATSAGCAPLLRSRCAMLGRIVWRYLRGGDDQTPSRNRAPKTANDWVSTFIPCWTWMQHYEWRTTLWRDVVAGLTVGMMVIPQGMSYAKLAGLPVQYGIYSALVPLYVYALFGSSRHLSVGPVAITSLLLSSGISKVMKDRGISEGDSAYEPMYVQLAIQTSLLVGVAYVAMAALRLGFITLFLSHAVISGFTSGAAIIIALSQLKYIFGYSVDRSDTVYGTIINLFKNISQFNYKTFLLGMGSLGILIGFKMIGSRYKRLWFLKTIGPLAVSVLGIVLVAAFKLQDKGIPIVGTIPSGLPPVSVNLWFPMENAGAMIESIITISLVGLLESIAIARLLAKKHGYKIRPGQELCGLGLSNVSSAMFSGYPITGSFSRSAVNNEAGAKTQVSSMVAATLVMLVLLFLTSVFELLPMCIIGAIIISGVIALVDYPEAIRLWKFDLFDFCVWIVTFLGVFFLGAELGLLCGLVLSFVQVLAQSALPRIRTLGRLPGSNAYHSITQYPEAESYPGCIVTSTDSPLYFLNAQLVKTNVLKRSAEMDVDTGIFTKFVVLDLTSVSDVDTCALHELVDWLVELSAAAASDGSVRGRQLLLANPNSTVMRRMDEWGFIDRLGREHCFSRVHDAVLWSLAKLEEEEDEAGQQQERAASVSNQAQTDSDATAGSFRGGEPTTATLEGMEEGVEIPAMTRNGSSPQTVFVIVEDEGLHHRTLSSAAADNAAASTTSIAPPRGGGQQQPPGPSGWIGRIGRMTTS